MGGCAEGGRADTATRRVARLLAERRQEAEQAKPSLADRQPALRSAAEGEHPELVPASRREVAERDCDALGQIRLRPVGGAEAHRGRRVEHEPGDEYALGELDAHVRLARPGGHGPVDHPDVVPGDVPPDHRELGAGPEHRRPVVACEQALHAAPDRDVERAQEAVRDRPRPGARRRAGARRLQRAHAALVSGRSSCGDGTAAGRARESSPGPPPPPAPGRRGRAGAGARRRRAR